MRDPGQTRPRAPRATQAKPGHTRRAQPRPDHEHCAQPRPTDPGSSLFLVSGFFFFSSGFFSNMFCWLLCFSPFHLLVVVFLDFNFFFFFFLVYFVLYERLESSSFFNFFLVYKSSLRPSISKYDYSARSDHGNRVFETQFLGQNRVF